MEQSGGAPGVAIVVGAGDGLGGRIARGLVDRGHAVLMVGDDPSQQALVDELTAAGAMAAAVQADPASDSLVEAFASAWQLGEPRVVVAASTVAAALRPRPVADVDEDEWEQLCDAPIRATLHTLQAARAVLPTGGRILTVVPVLAMTGASGLVALCTAGEAQRVLTKSAARQWSGDGITVNVVAADVATLGGGALGGHAPALGEPSLPEAEGDDLMATIGMLLSEDAARTTGATLTVDRGMVLLP